MDKSILLRIIVLILTVSSCSGQLEGICDGTAIVEFLPHPTYCTKYIICIFQQPSIIECQPEKVFNNLTDRCEPGERNCEIPAQFNLSKFIEYPKNIFLRR